MEKDLCKFIDNFDKFESKFYTYAENPISIY